MKFLFCVKLPDFQKERIPSGDQKTMQKNISAEDLSLSLPKKVSILKVLLKRSACKQWHLGKRTLKRPSLRMGRPETPTARRGTKELPDQSCHSRKQSPPFLLFHESFLAQGPCLLHAKMKQGGAVVFFGL